MNNSANDKLLVTQRYAEWFITNQSGDAELAARLVESFTLGWTSMSDGLLSGMTSRQVADRLRSEGQSVILLEQGTTSHQLPGRTATFLVMNREAGCEQIILERWTATADATTNLLLIGMGRKDVVQSHLAEKQIHFAAIELPKKGDYLEITTQSLSPLGKIVVVFVGIAVTLTGCTAKKTAPVPVVPPPRPTTLPPAIPFPKFGGASGTVGTPVVQGAWMDAAATYPSGASRTITWESYKIDQLAPTINPPLAGRKIDFVLIGNPEVNITAITGGTVAADGYSGSGVTDSEGEIKVTLYIAQMAYTDGGCTLRGTDVGLGCSSDAQFEITK